MQDPFSTESIVPPSYAIQKVAGLPVHFRRAGDLLSVLNSICAIFSPVLVSMSYHNAIRRRQICLRK